MSARQFDVFVNPDPESARSHPYLVALQSNALRHLHTVIAAPLVSPRKMPFLERLLPEVSVKGSRYVIAVPDLAAIPAALLKKPVANLEDSRYEIVAALDLVFTGV